MIPIHQIADDIENFEIFHPSCPQEPKPTLVQKCIYMQYINFGDENT